MGSVGPDLPSLRTSVKYSHHSVAHHIHTINAATLKTFPHSSRTICSAPLIHSIASGVAMLNDDAYDSRTRIIVRGRMEHLKKIKLNFRNPVKLRSSIKRQSL